jgi:hypothetical protein
MKIAFTVLVVVLAADSVRAQEAGVHLFILSGQSNMVGLKPEESFTPTVMKAFGEDRVIVIKDAQGGRPIRQWYKQWKPASGEAPKKTGDLYDRLMKKVKPAIEGKQIASVTFVWMQGERDAREKHGEVYADSLRGLIKQLSDDLGRDDVNFVIGRLSDFDMADKRYPTLDDGAGRAGGRGRGKRTRRVGRYR